MFTGQVIVGTWLSRTTTRCWQVAVLPLLSVAVQVTRLVPVGNCAGALLVIVTVPQSSLAVQSRSDTACGHLLAEIKFTATSAGRGNFGTLLLRPPAPRWAGPGFRLPSR